MKNNIKEIEKILPLTIQNASISQQINRKSTTFIAIKKYQSSQNINDSFYRPISKL